MVTIVTKQSPCNQGCVGFSTSDFVVLHCNPAFSQLFLALVLVLLSILMSLQKLLAFGAVKNAARDELLSYETCGGPKVSTVDRTCLWELGC